MPDPSIRSPRRRRRGPWATATALTLVALVGVTAPTASAADRATIDAAVARGADYLQAQQAPNGRFPGFGGDWALGSLVAAGRDVNAIRPSAGGPSALTAYRTLWTGGPDGEENWTAPSGPDPFTPPPALLASDYSRALLLSHAIGLEPTRLAANQNLVAQLAGIYHGRPAGGETAGVGRIEGNFGDPAPMSGAIGNLFALSRTAAPQVLLDTVADVVRSNQLDDGSWSWDRVSDPSQRAEAWRGDIDMTSQAIGAFCDIGVRPTDPAIVRGLDYLAAAQIPSGGIANAFAPGGDVNSTAAVVFALRACGIDPQGPAWTTGDGKTPIDFLIANQLTTGPDAGGFPASYEPGVGNLYASQEAVRALAGSGYVAEPTRSIAAAKVPDGTVVPQALVVDAGIDGTGERDLRVCRVNAPVGANVASLLSIAASSAQPSGCVTGLSVQDGAVRALNGVTGDGPQRTWLARVAGGPARRDASQAVCAGQIVSLFVGRAADASTTATAPCTATPPAPTTPTPQPPSPAQPSAPAVAPQLRVSVAGRRSARSAVRLDRKGRLRIALRCPTNAGTRGCWTSIDARSTFRTSPQAEAKNRRVGGRTVRVGTGKSRTVTVTVSSALRRDLRRAGTRTVRLTVRTHGDDARRTTKATLAVKVRPVAVRR